MDQGFQLADLTRIIKRNLQLILGITITLTALAIATSFLVPKKFKSKSVLSIPVSYFQIPLVDNLISQTRDTSELKSQRTSLIRLAISDSFLDQLGEKHQIFENSRDHKLRPLEREIFRKNINTISLNASSFQISVIAKTAETSFQMTSAVLEQIISTLIQERVKTLETTRNALQANLQSLQSGSGGISSKGFLESELTKIDESIEKLTSQFTENHPKLVILKKRRADIEAQIKNFEGSLGKATNTTQDFFNPASKGAREELYNELLKKLNKLNIVMNMENDRNNIQYISVTQQPTRPTSAYFPKKPLFAGGGFFLGLLLAGLVVLLIEIRRGTFLSPAHASSTLDVPFLGVLPTLMVPDKIKKIEDSSGLKLKNEEENSSS